MTQRAEVFDPRIARLTVEQVHAMVDAGILRDGEPIELIDGILVRKDRSEQGEPPSTIGKKHNLAIKLLLSLDRELAAAGCHMQAQGPICLPPRDEPEPDGAVLRGEPRAYADRLPTADDATAVFEIADSSLAYDRTIKLALYARAGIAQYVIVNLRQGCLEVHEAPRADLGRYEQTRLLRAGERLDLIVGEGGRLVVEASRILP
jgi:Uma2 family endonuclease